MLVALALIVWWLLGLLSLGLSDEQCAKEGQRNSYLAQEGIGHVGFTLSAECEALGADGAATGMEVVEACPTLCGKRLELAKQEVSRAARLAILSPRWNATQGDPLLAYSLQDVPDWQRKECIKLVALLASTVSAEGADKKDMLLFMRALSYYAWVIEHTLRAPAAYQKMIAKAVDVSMQLQFSTPPPSITLEKLPFWSMSELPSDAGPRNPEPPNLLVKHLSDNPNVLQIDELYSESECAAVAAWQDAHFLRQPPSFLCFARKEEAFAFLAAHGLTADDFYITEDRGPKNKFCFNRTFSTYWLTRANFNYVRNVDVRDGLGADGKLFQNDGVDEPLRKFDEFLTIVLGLPLSQADAMNAALYDKGGGYSSHLDCSVKGRRVTALLYLSETEGGETVFPKLNVTVQPKCGRLLVFRNEDADGTCNPRAVHRASIVKQGAKRILQRWYFADASIRRLFLENARMWEPLRINGETQIRGGSKGLPTDHQPFQRIILCADVSHQKGESGNVQQGWMPSKCRETAYA